MKNDQDSNPPRRLSHQRLTACIMVLLAWVGASAAVAAGAQADPTEEEIILRDGMLIQVSLPLTAKVASETIAQLRDAVASLPVVVDADKRAVIVLEFDTETENSGQGSDLGASFSLAEFLVGGELNAVRTVAYLPAKEKKTALTGHAILAAISCNEIAMEQGASIGNAGVDVKTLQPYIRDMYRGIAEQRLTLPVPIVVGMLDADTRLYRVNTANETLYVYGDELEKLEAAGKADETTTLSGRGEMLKLSSDQMVDFRLIRQRTGSRADLAHQLGLNPTALEPVAADERNWVAVRSTLPTILDRSNVSWLTRSIKSKLASGTDMVILEFGDMQADWNAALRLAEYLAALDPESCRTVAWVKGNCRGSAGVAALACDHVIFGPRGVLGQTEDDPPTPDQLETMERTIKSVASQKDSDRSLMMALVNPNMVISRYRSAKTGKERILGRAEHEELVDARDWVRVAPVEVAAGIDSAQAESLDIARTVASSPEVIDAYYQLETAPVSLQATSADKFIDGLAGFLTDPLVSTFLVMFAFICFMNELSAPGLGAFGFLGLLLLTAFFWSHYLDGSAAWFEILLFIVGALFLAIELFVVPGFGLFGIGGIVMMLMALVMAGQSFVVIPTTDEQFEELPKSLLPILGAFAGIAVGAVILKNVLPNTPLFRMFTLQPPKPRDEQLLGGSDPEATADWSHLMGRKGTVVTRLMPSGKAKIDGKVYDVITDGQVVQKGGKIEVIEAIANRVVVRPID